MLNFILIILCLLAGFFTKKYSRLPEDSHTSVNAWIINVALPAVALKYIPEIDWNISLLLPFLMPLLVWTGSFIFILILKRFVRIDQKTTAALLLTAGLGNTSFLGFPLTEAYFGEAGLQIAVLCDQACFIVMATFGIVTASKASNGGVFQLKSILKKILLFPPFIAFCLAFILPFFIDFEFFNPLLSALALTLVPLALFSVGLQLKFNFWRNHVRLISAALSYKLFLAPLFIFSLCLILGLSALPAKVSIFEAGMAPMVTGTIIATNYNLNPKLANIILGIGIPVSFITTFLWSLALHLL